jgi:DNA-directed RNA polymerase subunit RPC12/RpoP
MWFEHLSWQSAMLLEKNEQTVTSWYGDHETSERIVVKSGYGRRTQEVKNRKNGYLVLTSQKLVFLEEHGIFGKSYHPVMSIQLGKLGGVSMGGTLMPFVSIADENSVNVFHLSGIGKNEFDPFRALIVEWCTRRKNELENERKKERIQINFSFSDLKQYMANGGLVLQKTKCPECNAPIPLPETGNQILCRHCGSTILAQDVFEKIKSLI